MASGGRRGCVWDCGAFSRGTAASRGRCWLSAGVSPGPRLSDSPSACGSAAGEGRQVSEGEEERGHVCPGTPGLTCRPRMWEQDIPDQLSSSRCGRGTGGRGGGAGQGARQRPRRSVPVTLPRRARTLVRQAHPPRSQRRWALPRPPRLEDQRRSWARAGPTALFGEATRLEKPEQGAGCRWQGEGTDVGVQKGPGGDRGGQNCPWGLLSFSSLLSGLSRMPCRGSEGSTGVQR